MARPISHRPMIQTAIAPRTLRPTPTTMSVQYSILTLSMYVSPRYCRRPRRQLLAPPHTHIGREYKPTIGRESLPLRALLFPPAAHRVRRHEPRDSHLQPATTARHNRGGAFGCAGR